VVTPEEFMASNRARHLPGDHAEEIAAHRQLALDQEEHR
jgi:hypothetical protein